MSLILGVHLPTRIFLAADTRLTTEKGGTKTYRDNFWKHADFGPRVHAVTAGNASLAGFVLRKIRDAGVDHDCINCFKKWLKGNIRPFLDEYMKKGGDTQRNVAFIFGGYDKSSKKRINSTKLGQVMSKPLQGKPDGTNMDLLTNNIVIRGLIREAAKNGGGKKMGPVAKDTEFEIDFADSSVFAVEIDLRGAGKLDFRDIPCYGVVLFGQGGLREESATADLVQALEVEGVQTKGGLDSVYACSIPLMALITDMIAKHKLDTVGGDKLTMLLTPAGNAIPTGRVVMLDPTTQKATRISDIVVHKDKFCTRDEKGAVTPFEMVIDFDSPGSAEI